MAEHWAGDHGHNKGRKGLRPKGSKGRNHATQRPFDRPEHSRSFASRDQDDEYERHNFDDDREWMQSREAEQGRREQRRNPPTPSPRYNFDNDIGFSDDYGQQGMRGERDPGRDYEGYGYGREHGRRDAMRDRNLGSDERRGTHLGYGAGGRYGSGIGYGGSGSSSFDESWHDHPDRTHYVYGGSGRGYGGDEQEGRQQNFRGRGPKGYKKSDDRLMEQVCETLSESAEIDAGEIEVQVNEGTVSLTGFVESRYAKRRAEDLIEDIAGVDDVSNNLKVRSQADQRMASSKTSERSGPYPGTTYQSGQYQSGVKN